MDEMPTSREFACAKGIYQQVSRGWRGDASSNAVWGPDGQMSDMPTGVQADNFRTTNRPQSLKLEILAVASEIGPAPALTDMANSLRHSGSPMRRRRPAKRGSEWRLSRRESVVR
jgi:hypothetical protein